MHVVKKEEREKHSETLVLFKCKHWLCSNIEKGYLMMKLGDLDSGAGCHCPAHLNHPDQITSHLICKPMKVRNTSQPYNFRYLSKGIATTSLVPCPHTFQSQLFM